MPKRPPPPILADLDELAERLRRAMTAGHKVVVEDGDTDEAAYALALLLGRVQGAIEQAEAARTAALLVRSAIMRAQLAIGMTLEDVAAVHGISRQRVSQLLDEDPEGRPAGRKRVKRKPAKTPRPRR